MMCLSFQLHYYVIAEYLKTCSLGDFSLSD